MSEHFVPHILYRWDEGHPQPAWGNPHYTNLHDKVPGKKSLYLPETKSSHGPTPSLRKLHAYLIYINLPKDMGLLNILCARAVSHYTLTVETVFILKHGHLVYPR